MATRKKNFNFEHSLVQLEELVAGLETGELSLEESLKSFELGVRITRECNAALTEASQRVELLTRDASGELHGEAFTAADDA